MQSTIPIAALTLALAGCGESTPILLDAPSIDADLLDASVLDAPRVDARAPDAPRVDAGAADVLAADVAADLDAADDAPLDAPPDANCTPRPAGALGGSCTTDGQCDSGPGAGDGFCLRGTVGTSAWPAEGFCVNQIDSCATDAECGTGAVCAMIADPGGAFRACLPACGTGPCACAPGRVCSAWFAGVPITGGDSACMPGIATALDGDPCGGFGECADASVCSADPLESPGGECARRGCTIGDDTTCTPGGDGHCVDLALVTTGLTSGTTCVDACTVDSDCREADGYRCFDGGGSVGRYCRHPHAGDPCATDAECGIPATWDCKIGVTFPGGMCTPTTGCPTPGASSGCSAGSSVCSDSVLPAVPVDNVCVDRCGGPIGTAGGCRTGYVCRDVDPAPGAGRVVLGCVNP